LQTFAIEEGLVDGISTLRVQGDVDSATAAELRRALRRLPDGAAAVIDLHDVPFMDSAGLGALVCGFRELRSRGSELAVCVGRGPVRRLFEVCGFDRMIATGPTLDEALRALSADAETGAIAG
jgi:anti-sigma B factor antagonist